MTVVTGVSGSGKSSLAIDTIYAEGQRRYVESLSSYARQFLDRMAKPEAELIEGLPPAIAIEQRVISRNPRSTVGTNTEIYEYLRLMFARIGRTYSPISGMEVRRDKVEDVIEFILAHEDNSKFMILSRVSESAIVEKRAQGYANIYYNDEGESFVVIERMTVRPGIESRLYDACETAFAEGEGAMTVVFIDNNETREFSIRFELDGIKFEQPNELMFSFFSPNGACPTCGGTGRVVGVDERLVIPNPMISVYDGCVACWRGETMGQWKDEFCVRAAQEGFPVFTPYIDLSQKDKDYLWITINKFFEMVQANIYKIQFKVMMSRYRGQAVCRDCKGSRLKQESGYVKVGGKTIFELCELPINKLLPWFEALQLTDYEYGVCKRLIKEVKSRLKFLIDVGLGYLTLSRASVTLSGGESQRIKLTTALGSSLVGSLYVLDEPSIGLHTRDTWRLINVMHELRDLGNTVVVVEHDPDVIANADMLVEIGPVAGRGGGELIYTGPIRPQDTEHLINEWTAPRRAWNQFIRLNNCAANNLKHITVDIPLNIMTVITGVSGGGKSTLVSTILYPAIKRALGEVCDAPGAFAGMSGDVSVVKHIEYVDQGAIGKSTRSTPATYMKAFDHIRELFARQQLAKQLGLDATYFSFNNEGGQCEECKGAGVVVTEMQFMSDIELVCDVCQGQRYRSEVLTVEYRGKNVYEVLNMTVDEAIEFFGADHPQKTYIEENIVNRLHPLRDVGLGYVQLGQSSSTLSGGENQRVKLAFYLGQEKAEHTLFVFDEPTTGLHKTDIAKLLKAFEALIERGHTLVIVEHNLDMMRAADHIIDLGPNGGDEGGELIYAGTPEGLKDCERSVTAKYLWPS